MRCSFSERACTQGRSASHAIPAAHKYASAQRFEVAQVTDVHNAAYEQADVSVGCGRQIDELKMT